MTTIAHATQSAEPDSADGKISSDAWNEDHDITPNAFAQATITAETTIPTTSTWTDITGATVTLSTGARRVRISAGIWGVFQTGTTHSERVRIVIDGTALDANGEWRRDVSVPSAVASYDPFVVLSGILSGVLSAGSHTIKLQGWCNAGGFRLGGASTTVGYLTVEETDYTT